MGCRSAKPACQDAASFHEKYQITQKLGVGSAAQVYEVKRISDSTRWAVKIADCRRYGKSVTPGETDPEKEKRAEKEALFLRKVRKEPHVVNLVEELSDCIFSYIVLELCDMTLVEALDSLPVLNAQILGRFLCEMLQALAAIHKLGIVHCDVSPGSFLCTKERLTVKLCDFGSSEFMPFAGGRRGVRGVAPFTSPEMLSSLSYGPKTDVWSLGVIAYILLYGQCPYQPTVTTVQSMKAAILTGSPAPSFRVKESLTSGAGRIPEYAEQSTRALLARDPKSRPSAESAGRLPWFSGKADGEEQASHRCLKPMLYSAKRMGVFRVRSARTSTWQGTLDYTLARLQADFQGTSMLDSGHDGRMDRHESDGSGGLSQTPKSSGTASLESARHYHSTVVRKSSV